MMNCNTCLRKVILFLGLLPFSGMMMGGCNTADVNIDSTGFEQAVIQKLQKDSLIMAFNEIQGKLDLGIASNKFNLLHDDETMIHNNMKKCRTPDQIIALYERAGITHAREYFWLNWGKMEIAALLRRKYPELYKLPKPVYLKVLGAVVHSDLSSTDFADSVRIRYVSNR